MRSVWVGIVARRNDILVVRIDVDGHAAPPTATVLDDRTIRLQVGLRSTAYRRIQEWLTTYLGEHSPCSVAIKGSAVSGRSGATLGLLEAAEVRGVLQAAAEHAGASVHIPKKAALSKTFGERKVDEYVADDSFWNGHFTGDLRKGSREAALVAFAVATSK